MVFAVTELFNIDTNQKCSFLRNNISRRSQVFIVTELVVCGYQCNFESWEVLCTRLRHPNVQTSQNLSNLVNNYKE